MSNKWKKFFIDKTLTIKKAMRQMDQTGKKILFVVDKNKRLLGTVTDGDVRRWILADGALSKRVNKIYNSDPVYVNQILIKNGSKEEIRNKAIKSGGHSLPVVDDDMKIVDMYFWKDIISDDFGHEIKRTILNASVVIMAGGQGSRLAPFTKILPKALVPIHDKPVIEVIMEHFMQEISGKIYFILGYKAEMIKSYFNNTTNNYDIEYINEGEKPLGTAGGLKHLPKDLSNTFFLSNCDTIIKANYVDIYNFHKSKGYDITVVGSMQHFVVPYGVMKINSGGELKVIEEKPEYDFLVNTGMYVIDKKVLKYISQNGTFSMTDLIRAVKAKKGTIGVYPISEKSWLDIGQWESYKESTKHLLNSFE